MIAQPARGAFYLLQGFGLILKPGIRAFVLIPLLINFIFFALFIWLGLMQLGDIIDHLMASVPEWLQWLEWLIWPLFALTFIIIGFFISMMSANIIAAPFNGLLAEAVERHLGHAPASEGGGWKTLIKSLGPALLSEGRKIVYFLLRALPLLLLYVIPGINILAPVLWGLFAAWMLTLEYIDYPLSNHGQLFPDYRTMLRERRLLSLGFGGAALALTVIPVLNFIAIPVAVAGATAMAVKEKLIQSGTAPIQV